MANVEISLIVVNYKATAHVERLERVFAKEKDIELIVVDHSSGGRGYSEGLNTGIRRSHAPFVVCCNPDIEISAPDVRRLVAILQQQKEFGVIGPQILSGTGKVEKTCSAVPGPLMAAIEYSFLRTFPGLQIVSQAYRLFDFDHRSSRVVPSVNGSCFALRRSDFELLGGFDEGYFLYFEEFDLSRSLERLNKKIFFTSDVSVKHLGQVSTSQTAVRSEFLRSRRRFLTKWHGTFGQISAFFLELFDGENSKKNRETFAIATLVCEQDSPQDFFLSSVKPADAVYLLSDGVSPTWKNLARGKGWKYLERPLSGDFAAQRNAILEHITEDWTVFLDTDESLSSRWWEELRARCSAWQVEAFRVRRHDVFHGKTLQFGEVGAQRLLRVARTGTSRVRWVRSVHEIWSLPWHTTQELKEPILHFAHQDVTSFWRDISAHVQSEPLSGPRPSSFKIVVLMIVFPPIKFFQNLVLRSGWRDGWRGVVYALMMSWYSLMKRVIWYEKTHTL